ncbi:unnamed protein product [Caenorhabditis brenneri]
MYTFTEKEKEVYRYARKRHQDKITDLYEQRDKAYELEKWNQVLDINKEINKKVEEFNMRFPKGRTYLDVHGMTTEGAINYVARMTEGSGKKWMIETGQGRHSIDGKPCIKTRLLDIYGKRIRVYENNPGKLILDLE